MGDSGDTGAGTLPSYERRMLLQAALGTSLGLLLAERTGAQDVEPRNARPQEGDHFVFATGDRKGATVMPVDMPLGGHPVTAYPVNPRRISPSLPACTRRRGSWRIRRSVRMKAVMYGCGRERERR